MASNWQKNLQPGGRRLRLTTTLVGWSDQSIRTIETELLEVVRNLERSVRNETMYTIADRVVRDAKTNLRVAKAESLADSEENWRSMHLEDRLDFEWKERDVIQVSPPDDIPYAGITDMAGSYEINPVNYGYLQFYWFRHGFFRRETEGVYRPGNQYLTKAIKKNATPSLVKKELDKQIRYAEQHGANLTSRGGNIGRRRGMAKQRRRLRRQ